MARGWIGGGPWRVGRPARLILSTLLLASCSAPPIPEARIRETVREAEKAVERRALRSLSGYVSESYADSQHNDKRSIIGLTAYVLRAHESIHLATRIRGIRLTGEHTAEIVVQVAMAGVQFESFEEIPRVNADVYRFEISMAEEDGAWRVTRAEWRPAADWASP